MAARGRVLAVALSIAVAPALSGCQYVQDRLRECGHVQVDLVHQRLRGEPVNIVAEHEPYADENLLQPGSTRRLELCVERGDAKRFRAGIGSVTRSIVNCVVSRSVYEYEFRPLRVVFTDQETLVCEGF